MKKLSLRHFQSFVQNKECVVTYFPSKIRGVRGALTNHNTLSSTLHPRGTFMIFWAGTSPAPTTFGVFLRITNRAEIAIFCKFPPDLLLVSLFICIYSTVRYKRNDSLDTSYFCVYIALGIRWKK